MANTLIPIQTITVGSGNSSSFEFTNIPQSYTDLVIKLSARSTGTESSGYADSILRFNSSTTSYSEKMLYGIGTSANSVSQASTGIKWFFSTSSVAAASTFGNSKAYITNYTGSDNKSVSIDTVTENNSSTVNILALTGGRWANSAAITSVSITPGSGNWVQYSTATLYGVSNGVKAVGGTVICAGGYAYHTFTSTASFLPNQKIRNAETLIVAGGGGGGARFGGGGGAGGVRYTAGQTLNAGNTYTALVGSGGAGVTSAGGNGTKGADSIFGSYAATGGGYGAGASPYTGGPGGSGGGGQGAAGSAAGGAGTSGQGNNGGAGGTTPDNSYYRAGGGGGGAGAVGTSVVNGSSYGPGGIGTTAYSSWHAITGTGVLSSSLYYIGGGGGGGIYGGTGSAAGGTGGGGAGNVASTGGTGTAGTANTGGGGGGAGGDAGTGGAGGSGLIIVRYPLS
jgi:hypothetical protein